MYDLGVMAYSNNGCNAAECRACPVNHALAVSALIGSILDNDHVACLKYSHTWYKSGIMVDHALVRSPQASAFRLYALGHDSAIMPSVPYRYLILWGFVMQRTSL